MPIYRWALYDNTNNTHMHARVHTHTRTHTNMPGRGARHGCDKDSLEIVIEQVQL